jgi:hypothetical protein
VDNVRSDTPGEANAVPGCFTERPMRSRKPALGEANAVPEHARRPTRPINDKNNEIEQNKRTKENEQNKNNENE